MTANFDSTVNSLYLAFYGRPADPAGLKFWSQQVANADGDLTGVIDAFATSNEAKVRFGDDSTADRITEIYQQLFNRAPDAAGLSFWQNAVDKGNATIADVALAILNGSQGSDSQLVELRQQAMDKFTAQVEAAGSAYDGIAAIEAARVLVRAVTLDTKGTDIDTLVKAAVSFADTATKTPTVVEAIAVNTTLLKLYDTARGNADPVGLTQTLADTAKAAAGNPVTLDSLLRGGGMDKVLKVMPANATLTDVVKALASGGLPAAVEVVYPTQHTEPSTPVATPGPVAVGVTTNEAGVEVASDKIGKIYIDNGHGTQTRVYAIDGGDAIVGHVTLGQQATAVTGTVVVKAADGGSGTVSSVVALGSASADTLIGSHVWGYGGNDTILGTNGDDQLFGGDGNDLIYATLGADHVSGGSGADTIIVNVSNVTGALVSDSGFNALQSGTDAGGGDDHGDDTIDGFEFGVDTLRVSATQVANFNHNTAVYVGGGLEAAGPGAVGAFARNVALVDLDSNGGFGEFAVNFTNPSAALAVANLKTSIQYNLSGTDGNDNITTGSLADTISTGAGNDTIHAGAGADSIWGGAGADAIDLGVDSAFDTARFSAGDTATGIFVDGGSTAVMDIISNAGIGDRLDVGNIFTGAVTGHTSYLTEAAPNNYAVVRGSDIEGHFVAGTSTADNDYMIQWADGSNVNSIVLHDFGTTAPIVMPNGGLMVLSTPNVSSVSSVTSLLSGGPGAILLHTGPNAIVDTSAPGSEDGFANKSTFAFQDFRTGTAVATADNYTDGDNFHLHNNGILVLDDTPAIGLYKASWQNDTFRTDDASGAGYVAAGSTIVAGGKNVGLYAEGFTIGNVISVTGDGIGNDAQQLNSAFIDAGGATVARIVTGGGMDVVSDNGGKLTIEYDTIDASAQDLILGFDTGNDAIEFGGQAATLIDRDGCGMIEWQVASGPAFIVDAYTEAVEIESDGFLSNSTQDYALQSVADILNGALDLSQMVAGDGLLVLANGTAQDHGILLYYTDKDGNHKVDTNELTVVDIFSDGAAHAADIQLVGSGIAIPP